MEERDRIQKILQRSNPKLRIQLELDDVILCELVARDAITSTNKERIRHVGVRDGKVDALFTILKRKPKKAYTSFMNVLKEFDEMLYEYIRSIEREYFPSPLYLNDEMVSPTRQCTDDTLDIRQNQHGVEQNVSNFKLKKPTLATAATYDHDEGVSETKKSTTGETAKNLLEVYGLPSFLSDIEEAYQKSETTCIPFVLYTNLCTALDPEDPLSNDWRMLASRLKLDQWIPYLKSGKQAGGPTGCLLKEWLKRNETLDDLAEILEGIGRSDVAMLIRDYGRNEDDQADDVEDDDKVL